jgi:ribose 5-phosphate isomerase A
MKDPPGHEYLLLEAKEAAGRHAASLVTTGMRVGLGTGSTVHFTIEALAEAHLEISCAATSTQTEELARSLGLHVTEPDHLGRLDIAIDGADEVSADFHLTKGGGGAHTREKIVAAMADRFVVVVDESKLVDRLGPFGTPVEVLDFAPGVITSSLMGLGAKDVSVRAGRSDNGNLLLDAHFGEIDDPDALAAALVAIPGVVDHGIFPASMVERVVVAGTGGVRELVREPGR